MNPILSVLSGSSTWPIDELDCPRLQRDPDCISQGGCSSDGTCGGWCDGE